MPNNKTGYLLDEWVSIDLSLPKHGCFVESREVLGKGTPDNLIFEYSKKHNLIIVTKDYRFAEKILAEGYPVLLLLFRDKWGIVKPDKKVAKLGRFLFDKCTYFLMEREKIILP